MVRTQVWFNEDMVALHQDLTNKGLTSQDFSDFVKDAFHDKIDNTKASRLDLSRETIEKLAFECVQAETKKALHN